jgi:hypothetical protein
VPEPFSRGAGRGTDPIAAVLTALAMVLGILGALGLSGGAALRTNPGMTDAQLSATQAGAAIVVLSQMQYEQSEIQMTQHLSWT